MSVTTKEMVKELVVVWTVGNFKVQATVRNGKVSMTEGIPNLIVDDLDGCLEFIDAIKKAIKVTSEL